MIARAYDPKAASFYGQFVQAAYSMYDSAPSDSTPPPSADFPPGYRMVAWIQMQDFVIESTAPLFYGFIAESEAAVGQLVVALRGTSNGVEWWDDFNALDMTVFKNPDWGRVGAGFARIYDTLEVIECPAEAAPAAAPAAPRTMRPAGSFAQQISALMIRRGAVRTTARGTARAVRAAAPPPGASVEVTAHSLGAALATLYAMENAKTAQIANPMVCTFASPLVGDATFAAAFNALSLTSWRIDNIKDLVTKVPPAVLGFVHVDQEEKVDSSGKVWPNPGCWHSLETYLSLIDPDKQPAAECQLPAPGPLPQPVVSPALASRPPAPGAVQMTRPFVIDINHADNVQDTPGPLGGFARVKAAGIAFLIHKATEGLTFADPRYQARRTAWMNGIPIPVTDVTGEVLQITPRFAAYHFFHGEDPKAEAEFFLRTAQLQHGDDAVVDWEAVPGSGFVPDADAVDEFCNIVEAELGFPIIVYSGNAAKEQLRGKDLRFAKRRLWLAQYSSTFTVQQSWSAPWLWQNNGGQRGGMNSIPGIDGNCDNSTIASPMTVKQLVADWGGGAMALVARAPRGPAIARGWRAVSQPATSIVARRKIARYGWKPDLPDQRDHSYAVPTAVLKTISGMVDLRPQCPPVYDQGQIGSCTANAIAAALEFDMMKQNLPSFTPSRLFIYYNERNMEGTVPLDAGAYIRDGIKSVASQGDCPESEWTYDATPAEQPSNLFPPGAKAATAPSPQCYADAIFHKAMSYQTVDQNLADMKGCLSSGYPFVFGFTVYPSFESDDVARSGNVPMPGADEAPIGGHAVMAVGYHDSQNVFVVRNSWGPLWGMAGYCYMPYAYLLDDNLSDDFWTIRIVN
jgi:C1A family cysteine protease/GH25 family lysozyme M1 (1,4-beta-N-acetylmuramidase)